MTFEVITEEIINMELWTEPMISLDVEAEEIIDLSIDEEVLMGEEDYRLLKNKPSINGQRLIDNYNEVDPTVPGWAKESFKPTYTASEVGALDSKSEVSFYDLKAVWDSVFNS